MRLSAFAIAVLMLTGCASTQYKSFESAGDGIIVGSGGAKSVIDGVDLWEHGDPPRKFRVLGIIDDERGGGVIPMSRLHSDVAKKAREAGGDALIKIRSESQLAGYQSTSTASATMHRNVLTGSSTSTGVALRKQQSSFAVIKYVQ